MARQSIDFVIDTPARIALFNEIATHIHDRFQENGEPASKRRKVDSSQHGNGPNGAAVEGPDPADDEILLEIKEISVSVPQRKKLEMCLTQHYLYARAPGTTAPLPGAVFAWKDIGKLQPDACEGVGFASDTVQNTYSIYQYPKRHKSNTTML